MSVKTISPKTDTILRLADSLQAIDGSMIQSQAFYDFLRFQRDVQERISETWVQIESFMRTNDIPTVKGDWGHATLANKVTLAADTSILTDPTFYKQQLDSKKVKDYKGLFGKLPEGVTESTSEYLSKRISKQW